MKKRKLLRRLLKTQDYQINVLAKIIIEMIHSGSGGGGDDGDSSGAPELKLEARKKVEEYIKPEQLLHEYQ